VADDFLVVFTPSGKRGRFPAGTPLLDAARRLGVDIDSVCGGRGLCGRCQISATAGSFAKHGISSGADHLSPANEVETKYAGRRELKEGRRLGCQARVEGDLVIDVPRESQVHKQVVRKRAEVRPIELDPAIRLHYVVVDQPDMHQPTGDLERLQKALREQWSLGELECDLRTLQKLQSTLRAGDWKVTVAVHRGHRVTHIWPGFHDRAFGLAIDVGSTTVAAHLANLATGEILASDGIMNPQIRFGEDLMSRVSYVMMNPGGDTEMTAAIRGAINELIDLLTAGSGVERMDILNATVVGNPIMHHLLLGIDPTELGGAPFALAANSGITLWATELDLDINPDGRVYVLPCIAGHVGADTAGVILSESPHLSDEIMLVVDVGTNAELVLGNRERLLAASSPTGPAFEGAQISGGQRAAPGAIERVRIDRNSLEPRYRLIGCDLWSDEPGFADAVGDTGITGICGSGIIEAMAELYLAGVITANGTIDGSHAMRSPRLRADGRTFAYVLVDGEPEIVITQTDVRAIQLAKAALYAGARLLMDRMGIDHVDRVVLAGAFGSHIDPLYAMALGMVPDCPLDKITSAGNAAGAGALIALLNQSSRDEIEQIIRKVEKVETAVEPAFQAHFVGAMALPHASDAFPHLAAAIDLPQPNSELVRSGERSRRRGLRR